MVLPEVSRTYGIYNTLNSRQTSPGPKGWGFQLTGALFRLEFHFRSLLIKLYNS